MDQDFLLGDLPAACAFNGIHQRGAAARLGRALDGSMVFGSARVWEDGPPEHRRWYVLARAFAKLASDRAAPCSTRRR